MIDETVNVFVRFEDDSSRLQTMPNSYLRALKIFMSQKEQSIKGFTFSGLPKEAQLIKPKIFQPAY